MIFLLSLPSLVKSVNCSLLRWFYLSAKWHILVQGQNVFFFNITAEFQLFCSTVFIVCFVISVCVHLC